MRSRAAGLEPKLAFEIDAIETSQVLPLGTGRHAAIRGRNDPRATGRRDHPGCVLIGTCFILECQPREGGDQHATS
jgi:hypothetical protein